MKKIFAAAFLFTIATIPVFATGNVEVAPVIIAPTIIGGTLNGGTPGTVTSVAITPANGMGGSVANPTTTPAITPSITDAAAFRTYIGAPAGSGTSTGTNTNDQTDATLPVLSNGFTPSAYLRAVLSDTGSSGWIEGLVLSDGGSNTVNVSAGEFRIRINATPTGDLVYVAKVAATTGLSVPVDTTRYIIASYASGTYTITASSSDTSNGYDLIYLGEVHNIGGVIDLHNDPVPAGDVSHRIQTAWRAGIGTLVPSGEVTSDPASPSRKISVTGGTIINGRDFSVMTDNTINTNAGGTFSAIYGSGPFTYVATQTQWDNTQYDNAGVLTAMTVAYFGNHYVIRGMNGEIALVYGRAEYALQADAVSEVTPASLPEQYLEHGVVIAKITFQKSGASPAVITDLRRTIGGSAGGTLAASSHTALTDLLGCSGSTCWHMTPSEHTGTGTGDFVRQTSASLITPNITGVTNGSSAAAGSVGEQVSSTVSGVPLTNSVGTNLTSIPLTPGVWHIEASYYLTPTHAAIATNYIAGGINTVTGTAPNVPYLTGGQITSISPSINQPFAMTNGASRYVNISANTTYYLNMIAIFSNTATGGGTITATRYR